MMRRVALQKVQQASKQTEQAADRYFYMMHLNNLYPVLLFVSSFTNNLVNHYFRKYPSNLSAHMRLSAKTL